MRWRPLRRAATAFVVGALLVVLLSSGLIGSTFALFSAETQNANSTFAGGWIDAPTALTATPSAYAVNLRWTHMASPPSVAAQDIYGVDNGTNPDCSGAVYSTLIASLVRGTGSYNDTTTAATTGDWFCYQAVTTAGSWTAPAVFPPVQVGLAATSVVLANGGSKCSGAGMPIPAAGSIDCNDTITVGFNQAVANPGQATGAFVVCVWAGAAGTGSIVLGDTTGACGSPSDSAYLGVLTGATIATNQAFLTSRYTTPTTTIVVTLRGTNATSAIAGNPTLTFTSWPGHALERRQRCEQGRRLHRRDR